MTDIALHWKIDSDVSTHGSDYDYMWSSQADETREKVLASDGFVLDYGVGRLYRDTNDTISLAESTLKVIKTNFWRTLTYMSFRWF